MSDRKGASGDSEAKKRAAKEPGKAEPKNGGNGNGQPGDDSGVAGVTPPATEESPASSHSQGDQVFYGETFSGDMVELMKDLRIVDVDENNKATMVHWEDAMRIIRDAGFVDKYYLYFYLRLPNDKIVRRCTDMDAFIEKLHDEHADETGSLPQEQMDEIMKEMDKLKLRRSTRRIASIVALVNQLTALKRYRIYDALEEEKADKPEPLQKRKKVEEPASHVPVGEFGDGQYKPLDL